MLISVWFAICKYWVYTGESWLLLIDKLNHHVPTKSFRKEHSQEFLSGKMSSSLFAKVTSVRRYSLRWYTHSIVPHTSLTVLVSCFPALVHLEAIVFRFSLDSKESRQRIKSANKTLFISQKLWIIDLAVYSFRKLLDLFLSVTICIDNFW